VRQPSPLSSGRQPSPMPADWEYEIYGTVSEMTNDRTVKPLTRENYLDESDCTYMCMWMDAMIDEFKFGLLLCQGNYKLERHDDWVMSDHEGTERAVFLILCQTGVHIKKCVEGVWTEDYEDNYMIPGNFILLEFDQDYLFVTPHHKAVQLKVHDLKPASKKPRTLSPSIPHASTQATDMRTLLHQMSLCSNKM
jgi:hypothetical protein